MPCMVRRCEMSVSTPSPRTPEPPRTTMTAAGSTRGGTIIDRASALDSGEKARSKKHRVVAVPTTASAEGRLTRAQTPASACGSSRSRYITGRASRRHRSPLAVAREWHNRRDEDRVDRTSQERQDHALQPADGRDGGHLALRRGSG